MPTKLPNIGANLVKFPPIEVSSDHIRFKSALPEANYWSDPILRRTWVKWIAKAIWFTYYLRKEPPIIHLVAYLIFVSKQGQLTQLLHIQGQLRPTYRNLKAPIFGKASGFLLVPPLPLTLRTGNCFPHHLSSYKPRHNRKFTKWYN